jgi:hypothetical protein
MAIMHKRLVLALASGLVMTMVAGILVLHRLPLRNYLIEQCEQVMSTEDDPAAWKEEPDLAVIHDCIRNPSQDWCSKPTMHLPSWDRRTFDCKRLDDFPDPNPTLGQYMINLDDSSIMGTPGLARGLTEARRGASEKGVKLLVTDAYRPFKDQISNWCARGARSYPNVEERVLRIAVPGFSKHGNGCAVDVQILRDDRVITLNPQFRHDKDALRRDFEFLRSIMEPAGFVSTIPEQPFHWEIKDCSIN